MSVRGPALRNTDLRSRHAHMRRAVAHATIPPRRTAPTRPGRRRPAVGRWPGRKRNGAAPPASRLLRIACGDGPAAGLDAGASAAPRAGNGTARKNIHGKRTLSNQPPGDLQKLDRAVSYEESWVCLVGAAST